jgi:prepilin-type N-terminal cleavage/methylation domain-containing protein/prepilin-type processing-associated H-X9-DG protein
VRACGRRRLGFTLTELLVVMAVFVILEGLLLPVFIRAREKGDQVTCLAHLRQLGLAASLYAGDWDERWPSMWAGAAGDFQFGGWIFYVQYPNTHPSDFSPRWGSLWPYVKNHEMYSCAVDDTGHGCSFAMNALLGADPGGPGYHRGIRRSRVRAPSSTFLFCEERPADQEFTNDGYNIPANGDFGTDRHLDGANYAYCDGHAKWLKPDMVRYPSPDGTHRFEP